MSKVLKFWKTLAWSGIMLFLFLLPEKDLSRVPSFPGISQFFHIMLFAGFNLFLVWDLSRINSRGVPSPGIFLISISLSLLFGSLIELLQAISHFGRHAEIIDVLFDLSGSILAFLLIWLYFLYRRSRG